MPSRPPTATASFYTLVTLYDLWKCSNLRQIDVAAQEFALEYGKTNGDIIHYPNDLTPYIKLNKDGKIPPCPQGGIYSIKKVGDKPTCSLGTNGNSDHVLP
jgi:hypothetical protein